MYWRSVLTKGLLERWFSYPQSREKCGIDLFIKRRIEPKNIGRKIYIPFSAPRAKEQNGINKNPTQLQGQKYLIFYIPYSSPFSL